MKTTSKLTIFATIACLSGAALVLADDHSVVSVTADAALTKLKEGNLRFATSKVSQAKPTIVTQVATRDKVCGALSVAVVLLAFALPFLLLFWLRSPVKTSDLTAPGDAEGLESFVVIALLDIAGFTCFFFHFGITPGLLFLLAVLTAICVLLVQVQFTIALFWDLIRRYPSLPKRLFRIAANAVRGLKES
jgi:hypothetical protein